MCETPQHGATMRTLKFAAENLILLGLLVVILAIVLPARSFLQQRRRVAETKRTLRAVLNAGARYRMEYGVWPGASGCMADVRFGTREQPNRRFVNILRARVGPSNAQHSANPRKMVFWEPPPWREGTPGVSESGDLLDPWGSPFQIVVDADLNGVCEVPRTLYGEGIESGILAWSCGPDGKSDTKDDILSWR